MQACLRVKLVFLCSEEWAFCAQRETEEETGLRLKNVKFSTAVNGVFLEEDYHYVTLLMVAEVDTDFKSIKPENSNLFC